MRSSVILAIALLAAPVSAAGPELPAIGLGDFDRDEPISITAERLEARELRGGGRSVTFHQQVHVKQGPLRLRAELLEAIYESGASEPAHLLARGDVRIDQEGRQARCREARYLRGEARIVCHGSPAELRDGDDLLQGERVDFDLAARQVDVHGGARLWIRPKAEESGP